MGRRFALAFLTAVVLMPPIVARSEELELPNLIALPAEDLQIDVPDDPFEGKRALRFTTLTANLGDYPLELLAGEMHDSYNFAALQCVRWTSRTCDERRDIGNLFFETHLDHFHFHYEDFALYELRRVVGGTIDETPSGLAADGTKRAFCMQDGGLAAGFSWEAFLATPPFYLTCAGVLQGISPGWQDEYDWTLTGQQIVIDSVPDGDYALVITLDPLGRMFETTGADNRSIRRLRISDQGAEVTSID